MSKFASPSEAYIISQNIRYSQLAGIYADGTPTPQNIRLLDILNTIANEYNIPKQAFIDAQLKRYSELADIYAIATPIPQNIPQIDLLNEIATEYNIPNKDFINAQLTKYSQSIGMPIILKSKFNHLLINRGQNFLALQIGMRPENLSLDKKTLHRLYQELLLRVIVLIIQAIILLNYKLRINSMEFKIKHSIQSPLLQLLCLIPTLNFNLILTCFVKPIIYRHTH